MKRIITTLILMTLLISCSENDDNSGTLKVINQTDCVQNVHRGLNSNSDLIETVLANETKNITIQLGEIESSVEFFFTNPVDCQNASGEQYQVTINSGQETTIIIE